jgi:hypothetical protein
MANNSIDTITTTLRYIQGDIEEIRSDIKDMKKEIQQGYVAQSEFKPVKVLVYGLVGLTLTTVFSALVALVMK